MSRGAVTATLVSLRGLWLALFLLIALALAQQASMRHGLGHHALDAAQDQNGKHSAASEHCELCLLFAPVASGAAPAAPAPALLAHMAHARATGTPPHDIASACPAAHNRDPPVGT